MLVTERGRLISTWRQMGTGMLSGKRIILLTAIYAAGLAFELGGFAAAQPASRGSSIRDCPECPQMVSIPPGNFTMGAPADEEEQEGLPENSRGRSVPQHRVTISTAFAIGKYEVTRGEFAAFVRDTGYQSGDKCYIFVHDDQEKRWKFDEQSGHSWRDPGFAQTDQHPVVCVSWDDAQAYVAWLSRKTGHTYRLPSEAEWEYAARAGSPSVRFWGDGRDEACLYVNGADLTYANTFNVVKDNVFQCSDGNVYTSTVGEFKPNSFGLYDVLGNVWQWTEDCWNDNYDGAPSDSAARQTGNCGRRVVRGGSWVNSPRYLRSAYRDGSNTIGYRISLNGFRVARTL